MSKPNDTLLFLLVMILAPVLYGRFGTDGFQKWMRVLPVALLLVVPSTMLYDAWRSEFARNRMLVGLILVAVSSYMARYLYRRSEDRDASFFRFDVRQTDPEHIKAQYDSGVMFCAIFLMLFALYTVIFLRL